VKTLVDSSPLKAKVLELGFHKLGLQQWMLPLNQKCSALQAWLALGLPRGYGMDGENPKRRNVFIW